MEKKLVLVLFVLVFLSGCTDGGIIELDNNVITLENYVIGTINPYAGSATSIDFELQHNGNLPVKNLEVNFFDLAGDKFKIRKLDCFEGEKRDDHTCFYSEIRPLDSRKFSIELTAPDSESIKIPTKFTLSYYVQYDYSGFKQGNIPVIDPEERPNGPATKYKEGQSSVGPVQVDFEPPVGRQEKKDDQIIKEYWGVKDKTFQMKMNFKTISTSVGKVTDIIIPKNQAKLGLDKVSIASDLPCSFSSDGTAKEDVEVPSSLLCNFQPTDLPQSEITAIVSLSFDYTYKFTKSETFTIEPLENT